MRNRLPIRRTEAEKWALNEMGLQLYDEDQWGLRHWGGRETEDWDHNQREEPSFPILGHGNIFWMFRKLSDVSVDSFVRNEVGSGTQLGLQDEMGGVAKFINGGVDNNYQQYFSIAECLQAPVGGVITFRTKIRIADVDQCDMFMGFCERFAGAENIFDDRQDFIGWFLEDGSGQIGYTVGIGGDAVIVRNKGLLTDERWHELSFNIQLTPTWSRRAVNFFIDGTYQGTDAAKMPTDALCFAFGLRNGRASANEMSVTTTVLLKD